MRGFRIEASFMMLMMLFVAIFCINTSQTKYAQCENDTHNTFIAVAPVATDDYSDISEGKTLNNNNMNRFFEIKEFWMKNQNILENAAKGMLLSGIDYISKGKGYAIKNGNIYEIDIDTIQSITELLVQSEGCFDQIGWSLPGDPLFSNGKKYFYCQTSIFAIDGEYVSYTLAFSENPIEGIDSYAIFEALSPNWIIVTNYYGE